MSRSRPVVFSFVCTLGVLALALASVAGAQTATRWTDPQPAGVFFNDYDPNFHTGFVPRVQDRDRIKIHLARGNQLRVRMVLSDETLDHYLEDQVAKHDLYQAPLLTNRRISSTARGLLVPPR